MVWHVMRWDGVGWGGVRCMYVVLTFSLCGGREGVLDYIRGF